MQLPSTFRSAALLFVNRYSASGCGLLLINSTHSSSLRNVSIGRIGPNISSFMMSESGLT